MKAKKKSKKQGGGYPVSATNESLLQDEGVQYSVQIAVTGKEKTEILRREENRKAGLSKVYTLSQSQKMIRRKP